MSTEDESPLITSWGRFFDSMRDELASAFANWPTKRSVEVNFIDLHRHDAILADYLLRRPSEALEMASRALDAIDIPGADLASDIAGTAKRPSLTVRVVNLTKEACIGVADIRTSHAGKLVQVNGIVPAIAPPASRLVSALFICMRCGNCARVPQDEHLSLVEPESCFEDQGGCGRDGGFRLVMEHKGEQSVTVDVQAGQIQEPPESVMGTRTPVKHPFFVEGDLCGVIMPSDRIHVVAIVRTVERRVGNKRTNLFDYWLDVISVTRESRDYEEIDPTPEEIEEFHNLAASPDLVDTLVNSIAPTIHGRREAKLALALQLFGGVGKDFPDGRHIRGDIHVLLVGDPGVAKSELGASAARLSPRGHAIEASNASVAGIVGGVEKVERSLSGEGWVYQAGLVSMCHKGLLFIDEIDKPKDEALHSALLVPLEQQRATIAKHGAKGITVKCEFSLVAAMNPDGGRFDRRRDKAEQIKLPRPMMDRFDLVFTIEDEQDDANDVRLADSMLRTHALGSAILRGEAIADDGPKAKVNLDFLRRYVAWAKRTIVPVASLEVQAAIKAKFAMQRKRQAMMDDAPVAYSARTINSLQRLAEAAARMRLAHEITSDDFNLAADVYNAGWERLATNASGRLDADKLGSVPSYDMRTSIACMKDTMWEIQGEGVAADEVIGAAVARGVGRDLAVSTWRMWTQNGTVMERGHGKFVLTSPPRKARKNTATEPAPPASPGDNERRVRWS